MQTNNLKVGDYVIDINYDIEKDKIMPFVYGIDVD